MLPRTLTISAFGPYQDVVTISFDTFMNSGLFLITGPTGAGKTMIFDAVMFALYGTTSGSERQASQLRSDQADEKTKTFVELSFILHNEEFHIHRSPSYYVPGKKTPRLANAILTLPNGKMIEGVKEVNQKMVTLLGIDEKQFKQIAMIAQGEFTKLIYASSDDREKVLRNLFNTQRYRDLEERLKEETKIYKDKYDILFHQRTLQLKKLNIDDADLDMHQLLEEKRERVDILDKELQDIQTKYQETNQQLQYMKANNTRIQSLEDIKKQLSDLGNRTEEFKLLKERITKLKQSKSIQPKYEKKQLLERQIQKVDTEIEEVENRVTVIHKAFDNLTKEYLTIDNKKSQKEKWNQEYQTVLQNQLVLRQWLKDTREKEQIVKQVQKLEALLQEQEKQVKEKIRKLEKDQQSISMIDVLKQEFIIKQKEYETLHQRKTEIHALNTLYNRSMQEEDIRFGLEETYKSIEKEYDTLRSTYEHMERRYQYEQAGMLATTLQENQPCPVCGSLEHPSPANLREQAFDYHRYNDLKEEVTECLEKKNEAYQAVLLKKQELNMIHRNMLHQAEELGITKDLSKELFVMELSGIHKKEKSMNKSYQETKNEIQYLEKLKKTVDHNEEDVKIWQEEIGELRTRKQELMTKKDQIDGKTSAYTIDTSITLEEYETIIQKKQKQITEISEEIDTLEASYTKTKENKLALETTQKALYKQRRNLQKQVIDITNEFYEELQVQSLSEEAFISGLKDMSKLDSYEMQYQEYQTVKESLKNQKKTLEQEVGDNEKVDMTLVEQQTLELNIRQKELEQQVLKYKTEVMTYQSVVEDIVNLDNQMKQMQDQYRQYYHLSEITGGKNPYRVSLERYVLAAYFEKVLVYANEILTKMSQGRYQLYRRDNRSKGNAKQGLELDVLDLESGLLRDVKTLSGGESFKAALSLALGMSQMIQSYAGGIELQTLFIDEGFGSLDSQSLDQAIACLMELQQDNKLIGIISHVSELKERIDNKIIVTRNHQKSKIVLETFDS